MPKQKQTKLDYKQARRSDRIAKKSEDALLDPKTEIPASKPELKEEYVIPEEHVEALRAFDHNSEFGPSIDMSRMERWTRAEKLGKSPPSEIKEILLKYPDSESAIHGSVWNGFNLLGSSTEHT